MKEFADEEAVGRAIDRLSDRFGEALREDLRSWLQLSSSPLVALHAFEEIVVAQGNAHSLLAVLRSAPKVAQATLALLGSSQHLARTLRSNPELLALLLDNDALAEPPSAESILNYTHRVLAEARGDRHALDRLRYVKQRYSLCFAVADVARLWPQEAIWRSLSHLADALIEGSLHVVQAPESSLTVVAFGKLGGNELNYSSDIDLVFVERGGATDAGLLTARRLVSSLGETMGRGALYRVDCRLRPYGSRGELVVSPEAIEAYYENYAEPWEHLALIRSRVVVGHEEDRVWWNDLRERVAFKPQRGEWFLEAIFEMRRMAERRSSAGDIKSGVGGIRDVEFLAQLLQILHGEKSGGVRTFSTLDSLRGLSEDGFLDGGIADQAAEGYRFLRTVEHRLQMVDDRQTHELPTDLDRLSWLAASLGFDDALPMQSRIESVRTRNRRAIAEAFPSAFPEFRMAPDDALPDWLSSIPGMAEAVLDSHGAGDRVSSVERFGAAVVTGLRQHPELVEQIVSGELLEEQPETLLALDLDSDWARSVEAGWLKGCLRFAMGAGGLGRAMDRLTRSVRAAFEGRFASLDWIALGSAARRAAMPFSDVDLLLLSRSDVRLSDATEDGHRLVGELQAARRQRLPLTFDLRLRPLGRQGPLVTSVDALLRYLDSGMEPWERMAFLQGRSLSSASREWDEISAALSWRPSVQEFESLVAMKRRVEQERLRSTERDRDLKLGHGYMDDLVWTVQLLELWSGVRGIGPEVGARALRLAEADVLGDGKANLLVDAADMFSRLRAHNQLIGFERSHALPAEPDRLLTLATAMGRTDVAEMGAEIEGMRVAVRELFLETVERVTR